MNGIIRWWVDNPVAANLLMGVLVLGGIASLSLTHQEEFPNIDPEVIQVTVPYLGAAPEEAESGVCIRIEEAIEGLEGIEKVESTASEGACNVSAFILDGADSVRTMNELKSKVDGISTLPAETEKPIVSKVLIRAEVLSLAIMSEADERTLKEITREIRDEIAALPGISQVDLAYARPYEVTIEVSEHALRRWGLTMGQVADVIRRTSLDMPGGTVETKGGEILLRTKGQAYTGDEFANIVLLTRADGSKLYLSEVANIIDGFQDGDLAARFDGRPSMMVKVFRVGEEDIVNLADAVKTYVANKRTQLPAGVDIALWSDASESMKERVGTLTSNAMGSLILVVITLTLFLRFKLAMWVSLGIPVALLGAIMCFPLLGISISSLTVMAFILVIGVVVDDATVVGERVFALTRNGLDARTAAVQGTAEMAIPVVFGVLTTVAAFLPLLMIPGRMGDFFSVIPLVVILCLTFSLIESQWILPAHLAGNKDDGKHSKFVLAWRRIQDRFAHGLEHLAEHRYRPALKRFIEWQYVVAAVAVALLIICLGMISSGRILFEFFPPIEGERIYATIEMPQGIAVEHTIAAAKQVEEAAQKLKAELEAGRPENSPAVVRHIFTSIGQNIPRGGPQRFNFSGISHLAEVALEIAPLSERGNTSTKAMSNRWRELTGGIPDAVELSFDSDSFSAGAPIAFRMRGRDVEQLREAAAFVRTELARYPGVFDVRDSFRAGKQEIKLRLKPEARVLGLTLNDLGRQVRQAFYGEEAQRIQRGQDEVRVMVRYPEIERESIGNLEDMRIRTADGSEVPFSAVAEIELGTGYSSIRRIDGERVVDVAANVDRTVTAPERVIAELQRTTLSEVTQRFPNVRYTLGGEQEERMKAMLGLALAGILALFLIYALLAVPLKSYAQPLVIMVVIPFGAIGAILGHYLLGQSLMFFSALGIVALSGVVVNGSLVLVDYINQQRRLGEPLMQAVLDAGVVRFRPIILTSTTTFIGLFPMMFSKDPTTFFIVPMAISLGFGVLFATTITLILVPSLYLMQEDFLNAWARFWGYERKFEGRPLLAQGGTQTETQAQPIAGD